MSLYRIQAIEFVRAPIFSKITQAGQELQQEVYVVGGYVRDCLLKREMPSDIDFVTLGSGIELAKKLSSKLGTNSQVHFFKNFGTAMLHFQGMELEFVGARKESYDRSSRKPVVEDGSLDDDQKRRDFTINALAISLNPQNYGQLIDPFNGIGDLENRIIRTPLSPDKTFSDDPLRMLRAVRFACQLEFHLETETKQALSRNAHRLEIISAERIIEEFQKIMNSNKPSIGLGLLFENQLLHQFFPELVALQGVDEMEGQLHKDNFYHTLEVVDNVAKRSSNVWLRWAALLHDIGKPIVKRFDPKLGWTFHNHEYVGGKMLSKIFHRLRLNNGEPLRFVQKLVQLSSRPVVLSQEIVTDSAVRRLLFEAGDDIDDLMLLCECDITTKNPKRKTRYLKNFELVREKLVEVEALDKLRNWQPPIDGEYIMRLFGLGPGKEIGILKTAIREAILEGEIANNFEAAHSFLIKKAHEMGLKPL